MNNKWDIRFIELARHIAQWSKDPSSKCGAVITDRRNRVVSVGFNGFARKTDDDPNLYLDREYKYDNVIHCEENAILSAARNVEGCSMYLTGASCSRCTARVIQVGIDRVVIPCKEEDAFSFRGDWDSSFERSRKQFKDAGVCYFVLGPTGYDPRNLMGPEHPFIKKSS